MRVRQLVSLAAIHASGIFTMSPSIGQGRRDSVKLALLERKESGDRRLSACLHVRRFLNPETSDTRRSRRSGRWEDR